MDISQFHHETALRRHIYNYMVERNFHNSAELFKEEADIPIMSSAIGDSQFGFLSDWWFMFWNAYNARPTTNHGLPESFFENIGDNRESPPPIRDINEFYDTYSSAYVSQEASSSRTPAQCYECLEPLGMFKPMDEWTSVDTNPHSYFESLPSGNGATYGENHEPKRTPTKCYDWDELSLIFKPMGESTSVDVNSYNYNVESLPSTNGATDGENQEFKLIPTECYDWDELSVIFKPMGELTGVAGNSHKYNVESLSSTKATGGENQEFKQTPAECSEHDEHSVTFKPVGESTSADVNSQNCNVESIPSSTEGASDGETQELKLSGA